MEEVEIIDPNCAQVYVGTYKKYAEGSIFGEWVTLSDFDDKNSFLRECRRIHSDEKAPELMFQDAEVYPSFLAGETFVSENFWDFLKNYNNLDSSMRDAYSLYCDDKNCVVDLDEFYDAYEGTYESLEDYGYALIKLLEDDIPDWLFNYIDCEEFGRDEIINGDKCKIEANWKYYIFRM